MFGKWLAMLLLIGLFSPAGADWFGEVEFGKILEEGNVYYTESTIGYGFDSGWLSPYFYTTVFTTMDRIDIRFAPLNTTYVVGSKVYFGDNIFATIQHGCLHSVWSGNWTTFWEEAKKNTAVTTVGIGASFGNGYFNNR